MDLKGDKMNWAMYVKWTNRKQQCKKGSIIELLSDGEGDTSSQMMKEPKFKVVVAHALCLNRLHNIWSFPNNWC
jgi:hypothetical protein